MTRPTTRSRARDGSSTTSIIQTVPQKRERAAPKSKNGSARVSTVQNEDVGAAETKGVSTSTVIDTESPNEASSKPGIIVKPEPPLTPNPSVESKENQSITTARTDNSQTPSILPTIRSPVEDDSGISLASPDKEGFLPKEMGIHETSTGLPKPSDINHTVDKADDVFEEDTPAFIELPHNMGIASVSTGDDSTTVHSGSLLGKIESRPLGKANVADPTVNVKRAVDTVIPTPPAAQKADATKKSAKKFNYGLTPGRTPFPDFKFPSAEACYQVNDILSKAHGEVIVPKTIPEPSLTVAGCGEVPSVLDALVRTLLSGATSGRNSARAFNGLVQRFGTLTEGVGKGSVNWDAVRQAPLSEVFDAIKSGGLADVKSKNLKALLDQVYEENQERKNRHADEDSSETDDERPKRSPDEAKEAEEVKEYDIASANDHFLNLQYMHKYKTNKALRALIRYPGIGPKTAACVLLFCLRRPCFAVDTHIFRITKWLGWVPDKANEIAAFSHLDAKIPDELKYSLHQLLIKHGKECPRCRAITSPASADWDQGCVIEDLVRRTGRKIIGSSRPHAQAGPAKQTSGRKTGVVKKITKSKRTSGATKAAVDKEDALQSAGPESAEQLDQPQPLVGQPIESAQENALKRKRTDTEAQIPQRKQSARATRNKSQAAAPKAKSAKNQKKASAQKTSTKKPAKKPKAAVPAATPTRTSSRLKSTIK